MSANNGSQPELGKIDFKVPDREIGIPRLAEIAREIRTKILLILGEAKSGHPGGSLSATDILVALYFAKMKHDPKNPKWEERDRFLLSKGHAASALFAVLSRCGYIPDDELKTYRKLNSRLQGHADPFAPGVEIPSGPLGMGLSEGIGMALAGKLDKKDYTVYVLMGDGEQDEGEVWEAAMSAAKFKLDNIVAIIDKNGVQQSGPTSTVMPTESLAKKWAAFNWNVVEIDGHDLSQIVPALSVRKSGMPTMIVANTVKGKGVDFMEGKAEYHGKVPDKEKMAKALDQLKKVD